MNLVELVVMKCAKRYEVPWQLRQPSLAAIAKVVNMHVLVVLTDSTLRIDR